MSGIVVPLRPRGDDDAGRPELFERSSEAGTRPTKIRPLLSASSVKRWYGKTPPAAQFVVHPIIPRGAVTLLAGDGGTGKSMLAQTVLALVAYGADAFGLRVDPGAVAGIFGEDSDGILHGRHDRICRDLSIPQDDSLAARLHVASYLGTDMALWRSGKPTKFFETLEAELATIRDLRLAVIDSASLVFAGNENDRGDVASFMMALNGMADRLRAAILLLSHTSKSQTDAASGMASGSTSWVWQARSALRLKLGENGDPELHHMKANHSRKLDVLALQWSPEGVLRQCGAGPARLSSRESVTLDCLESALAEHGEDAPEGLGLLVGTRVLRNAMWRPMLEARLVKLNGKEAKPAAVRQWVKRSVDALADKHKRIGRTDAFVWLTDEVKP